MAGMLSASANPDPVPNGTVLDFPGMAESVSRAELDELMVHPAVSPRMAHMPLPVNAVLCEHRPDAERFIRAFGLDRDRWTPIVIGDALTGRRFDKLVMICSVAMDRGFLEKATQWLKDYRHRFNSVVVL
jgi:hypothetical protein